MWRPAQVGGLLNTWRNSRLEFPVHNAQLGGQMRGAVTREEEELEKIEDRMYRFALRVIKLVQSLPKELSSSVLARQLPRAATKS